MKDWHPKSWTALLLGICVLVYILLAGLFRMVHPSPNAMAAEAVGAWKELMLAIVGGLLVWIGNGGGGGDADQ